jgi:CAAX protease family protein
MSRGEPATEVHSARALPAEPGASPSPAASIAPAWHTGALVLLIVAVALTGTLLGAADHPAPSPAPGSRVLSMYAPVLIVQAALTLYVCRVGRPASALSALVGRGWATVARALGDVALACAAAAVIEIAEAWFARAAGPRGAIASLLPHAPGERAAWTGVAIAVAFGEELVYRGYLQTQLAAFTGRPAVAIALQGILFGIAHADQGPWVALRFAAYGIGLGALARRRRSLIPGMLAHAGIDVASGWLG